MAAMASVPRTGRGPRVESWSIPQAAVERWLKNSRAGDKLVYNHGHIMLDPLLAEKMDTLQAQGEVCLTRKRTADGAFDYLAIRNRVRVVLARPSAVAAILDAAMNALFLRLKASARLGERCPSDAALGTAIGITKPQVKWAMRKLVDAGLIHTRLIPTTTESKYRVVTIVESGLETRLPPKGGSR